MTESLPYIAIEQLTERWQRIAMIASLCERHAINHQLYRENAGQAGTVKLYRKVLNKVWEYLAGQLKSMKNLEKALLEVQEMTPEPTESDGYGIYPALDACSLLTSCLQMILDNSAEDLDVASGLSMATVAQFIELVDELSEFDPEHMQHPLFDAEVALQNELIKRLQQQKPQTEIVQALRRWLGDMDVSNLGITLS